MEHKLKDAFFAFRHHVGTNGCQADVLLKKFANDAPTNEDAAQHTMSHKLLQARLDFVEEGARKCFKKRHIEPMIPKTLQSGGESLVFDCSNGHVLKIRKGESVPTVNCPHLLQPVAADYSPKLDVTFSVFPKVETEEITKSEAYGMQVKTWLSGYRLIDPNPYNFGKVGQGSKKKIVIIDEGAVKPIGSLHEMYWSVRDLLIPAYMAVPIIHPVWRACREAVKEMLGLPPREKPVPNSLAFRK